MQAKLVPGADGTLQEVVPSRQEQLRELHLKLAGHRVFGSWRGKMSVMGRGPAIGLDLGQMVSDWRGDPKRRTYLSPAQFARRYRAFSQEVFVITNLLCWLRFHKWDDAAKELEKALTDSTYIMDGEAVPVEKTMPVTIVVFDLPRTLEMLSCIFLGQDTERLHQSFPSLGKYMSTQHDFKHNGEAILQAYWDDVLEPFGVGEKLPIWKGRSWDPIDSGHSFHLEIQSGSAVLETWGPRVDSNRYTSWQSGSVPKPIGPQFGFLVPGEQSEVLRKFTREQQEKIATWQCQMPRFWTGELTNLSRRNGPELPGACNACVFCIGFHPESEHGEWLNRSSVFPSAGFSSGYGVRLCRQEDTKEKLKEKWPGKSIVSHTAVTEQFGFVLEPLRHTPPDLEMKGLFDSVRGADEREAAK